ncbi:MAG: AEC family transporter [Candidatus Bipolaricaulota bacterium]|nr:AEC family transporter [Candidatus Bipolaricaulota bacterium]
MLNVLLPTFLLVGAGWLLGRLGRVEARPLGTVAFWVLSPALIFESLRTADLSASGIVVLFALLHQGVMFLVGIVAGRFLFSTDGDARRVTALVLAFGNCGNLGLPLLLFAYGSEGVSVGVLFLATQVVLLATLGVGVAAWDAGRGAQQLWRHLGRAPWAYAVGAALVARWAGVPEVVARATTLLAQGAFPLFLLLLGLELAQVREVRLLRPALVLALVRLGAGSAVAWVLARALGLGGVLRGSLVLEGSVPTAVNALLLAFQYGRRPDLAASVLFLSTLLSLGTLPLVLFLLGVGG